MQEGLPRAVAEIKEKGLPSKERMRADLAKWDAEEYQAALEDKVAEYRDLFQRFSSGAEMTDKEQERMTDLSEELAKIAESIKKKDR